MLSLTGRPLERPDQVRVMMDRLIHRGPDEEGFYLNRSRTACLGHRRLKVIDLATGRQPLGNEDDSVMITFNGEIYGFQSLGANLEARGHQFRSKTDTEIIVHLYEDEGISCLQHLKGMFAFALWDERAAKLFLVRDRLGKKPLYYAIHHGVLAFASGRLTEVVGSSAPPVGRCPTRSPAGDSDRFAVGEAQQVKGS